MLLSISIVQKKVDIIDSNIKINSAAALEAALAKDFEPPEYGYMVDQVWETHVSTEEDFLRCSQVL